MENDKDAEWLPFLKGQNAHTRAVLESIPGRARFSQRIQQLSGDTALTRECSAPAAGCSSSSARRAPTTTSCSCASGGHDRVLIDPTALVAGTGHLSLDWWQPRPNGAHIVYGLSKDGSEDSVLHVLDVADGAICPSAFPTPRTRSPQWLDDGTRVLLQPADRRGRYAGALPRQPRALSPAGRRPGGRPDPDAARARSARVDFEPIQMP